MVCSFEQAVSRRRWHFPGCYGSLNKAGGEDDYVLGSPVSGGGCLSWLCPYVVPWPYYLRSAAELKFGSVCSLSGLFILQTLFSGCWGSGREDIGVFFGKPVPGKECSLECG